MYTYHIKQNHQYGGWDIHAPGMMHGPFEKESMAIEEALLEAELPGNEHCAAIITPSGVIDLTQSKDLQ